MKLRMHILGERMKINKQIQNIKKTQVHFPITSSAKTELFPGHQATQKYIYILFNVLD